MNLYFRFVWLLVSRLFIKQPISVFDKCRTRFRVNPLDLDLNFHMNNGRYFSIMDLGRFDLMLKSQTFWLLAKKGCFPVVSSQSIRFKKSLGLFDGFDLITEIEAWDDTDFYINQTFVKDGLVYAEGLVKGRFLRRGDNGSVTSDELFTLIGVDYRTSEISDRVHAQKSLERFLVANKNYEETCS